MTNNHEEASAWTKKRKSLSARTIRYTVLGCVLFGLIAELIGVSLYGRALALEYIKHAFNTAQSVAHSVLRGEESVALAETVMGVYRNLTEEQRQQVGTPAYSAYFEDVDTSEESTYAVLADMLGSYIQSDEIADVYLAMYDQKTSALVYMVDPQEEDQFEPGEWETVDEVEVRKFLDWDGNGMLFDISNMESYGWICSAGVPIRNAEGNICAFALSDVVIDSVLSGMVGYTLQITVALLIVTALIAWFMSRHIKKAVVQPVNSITKAAEEYVQDKRAGETVTNRFSGLNIHSGDELEQLSLTMGDMERQLSEHEDQIIRISAEKERISTELNMASKIQESMLPNLFPAYPEMPEFDIFAKMDPAKEVGGDFYDFFLIDDNHLCMVMADVSGKGVPAALFMMVSKAILQSCANLNLSTAEILQKTNDTLCGANQVDMFVTVWIGILEISTGKVTAANGGHLDPAVYRKDGAFALYKVPHDFLIGGMPGMKYHEYEIQLHPGDKLFLYTDGVPEATNAQEELFGAKRMLDALNEKPKAAPKAILSQVRRAVDAFVGEAEQFDDLTMLCLEYKGTGVGSTEKQEA